MSEIARIKGVLGGIRGRWQIPLLIGGLVLFALPIRSQIKTYSPVTFAEEVARINRLHEAKELSRAAAYIKDLLKKPGRKSKERGELHRLYAQTAYLAESPLSEHQRQNVAAIVSNYQTAINLHAVLGPLDWLAMGDAFVWSERHAEAVEAFHKSIELGCPQADRVRRHMIEMEISLGGTPAEDVRRDLESMLADPSTTPANYLWAGAQLLDRLLEQGSMEAAEKLLTASRERLSDTSQRGALAYCEALYLRAKGEGQQAETLLREFRDQLQHRDEFWAKSGWLLGRLHQEDGRPQTALSFYDDVLLAVSSQDVRALCELGRAESLAALGRYDTALEAFREFDRAGETRKLPPGVDRGAVRMTLASIAESLRQEAVFKTAIEYFEQALKWTPAKEHQRRGELMSRMADCHAGLAAQQRDKDGPELQQAVVASLRRAADLRIEAAQIEKEDDRRIKLLELAVDEYEAAGAGELALSTLAELAARHPRHPARATALHRLAQAYRAAKRYPEAIATFDEILTLYPRLPDALRSMVPLADCLLHMGEQEQKRGVEILTSIVDGTGGEQVFTPDAGEYRQALYRLSEFLSQADDARWPDHHERAISRLEDALTLYPDDPEIPRLSFLLADAYRRSALGLRGEVSKTTENAAVERTEREAAKRLARASELFGQVISKLAAEDASALSQIEETYLQSSYVYRGDCQFELGEYEQALESYREAAWRYENLPIAISAGIQEFHCLQRLGRGPDGRACLGRLGWLLKKMPETAFDEQRGMSSKGYWQGLLERLEQTSLN